MNARIPSTRISKYIQQFAAITLVVMSLAGVFAMYTLASGAIASNEAAIDERRAQLGRILQVADWKPGADEPAGAQGETAVQKLFSPGDASAVSLAEFQERLKKHAVKTGAQIVNVTERPVKEELGFSWIGLHVTVIGRFGAVAGFLAAVESASPYTAVVSGRITADPDLNRASTPDARLDARLEFYSPVRPATAVQ